jgi:hypothetical protein
MSRESERGKNQRNACKHGKLLEAETKPALPHQDERAVCLHRTFGQGAAQAPPKLRVKRLGLEFVNPIPAPA